MLHFITKKFRSILKIDEISNCTNKIAELESEICGLKIKIDRLLEASENNITISCRKDNDISIDNQQQIDNFDGRYRIISRGIAILFLTEQCNLTLPQSLSIINIVNAEGSYKLPNATLAKYLNINDNFVLPSRECGFIYTLSSEGKLKYKIVDCEVSDGTQRHAYTCIDFADPNDKNDYTKYDFTTSTVYDIAWDVLKYHNLPFNQEYVNIIAHQLYNTLYNRHKILDTSYVGVGVKQALDQISKYQEKHNN